MYNNTMFLLPKNVKQKIKENTRLYLSDFLHQPQSKFFGLIYSKPSTYKKASVYQLAW